MTLTRRHALFAGAMLAQEGMAMQGFHMPASGAGFVEAMGDGFRWVPVSYQFM